MATYILDLSDTNATLETVGGKGASVARLVRAGLPVPGGFHVTTAAYDRFVDASGLRDAVLGAAAAADPGAPDSLERASREIASLFERSPIPPDVADAVRRAYDALGDGCSVAVRSSATAEDLPEASFAGQQESYLNVRGADEVLRATRRCWASLWTARAIAYRARHGIDHAAVSLSVLVQEMVMADAAGIAFSADPVSGARGEAMITASWGLGEAVVGGQVTPDTITVSKADGRIVRRETADKQLMTALAPLGTEDRAVPEELRRAQVLTDAQACEVAALASRIEALYGAPMDIEWTLAGGRIAIVQARPITTLPEEAPAPLRWERPDPTMVYMRGSMAEFVPQPASPLFATLAIPMANRATRELFGEIAGERAASAGFSYVTINGYVYAGTGTSLRRMIPYILAVAATSRKLLTTGLQRWRDQARPAYLAAAARWEGRDLADVSATGLVAGVREIVWAAMKYYNAIQSGTIPTASSSEVTFTRLYGAAVRRRGDPEATAFLVGFDSAPILAEKALWDLAEWCALDGALADHLRREPTSALARDLADGAAGIGSNVPAAGGSDVPAAGSGAPAGVADGTWAEWRARFRAYLDEHGRATYDLDFARPVPSEAPEPILETLKLYLRGGATSPHERQRLAAERREQATRDQVARLDPLRRRLFLKVLRWAQTSGPLREDSIAGLGIGYPQIRRLLSELGRRLVAAGAIRAADDIYWLIEDELEQAVAHLEAGTSPASAAELVVERKALWRAARATTAPAILPETSRLARFVPGASRADGSRALRGVGSGAGTTTGRACVLLGPEDFGTMRPGDVLVAVTTTPAWTPLFAMASGVVTDIGGPLSHSSIVAREYGIPAVMGVGEGTRLIRTGQTITVDGTAGRVYLADEAA